MTLATHKLNHGITWLYFRPGNYLDFFLVWVLSRSYLRLTIGIYIFTILQAFVRVRACVCILFVCCEFCFCLFCSCFYFRYVSYVKISRHFSPIQSMQYDFYSKSTVHVDWKTTTTTTKYPFFYISNRILVC